MAAAAIAALPPGFPGLKMSSHEITELPPEITFSGINRTL
jgi:hypothetical protein